jgi:hypothetical protein
MLGRGYRREESIERILFPLLGVYVVYPKDVTGLSFENFRNFTYFSSQVLRLRGIYLMCTDGNVQHASANG